MDIKFNDRSLVMWAICEFIKDDPHLLAQFDYSWGMIHDAKLTIDGVELNFLDFINHIDKIYDDMVQEAAGRMYLEEYDRRSDEIIGELSKIARRLKEIRRVKFPEIDWGDDR